VCYCVLLLLLLLQIALDADGNSYQYEDVTIVEGSAINSDLVFSADHTHLYVMTSNKVRHRARPTHCRVFVLLFHCLRHALLTAKHFHLFNFLMQVTKLALWQCERFISCEECRAARDPFCGWCSLERRYVQPRHATSRHYLMLTDRSTAGILSVTSTSVRRLLICRSQNTLLVCSRFTTKIIIYDHIALNRLIFLVFLFICTILLVR